MSLDKEVLVSKNAGVMRITINRPEFRNALDLDAHHALSDAFDDYTQSDDLKVCVITGTGNQAFCAGSDLKKLASVDRRDLPSTGFAGLCERFDLTKPVIAAINGHAIGGGMEILLACDLAISVDSAKFGLPEPKVGLISSGGLHRLARNLPIKQAMKIALTGELFDANEAKQYHLVNQVVGTGELEYSVDILVGQILECAPMAVRATKQMMMDGLAAANLKDAFAARYALFDTMLDSQDAREGIRAFNEKRKPVWRGN